jgi:cytoskeleton protein RodZ
MALFSRRKDTPEEPGTSERPKATAADTVAELRPARRRTVGQLLRETRESYGSDIPRVAAALRIRAAYLEAIEEGSYDRLPGPVYALGFVRAYAVHLGLDGEEAVRRFKLEAEGFEAQRDLSFPVPLAERSMPGGAMVLAALILAVCAYGIWYYLSSTNRSRPERVSPVPAELAKPAQPPAGAPSTAATTVPAPAATPPSVTAPAPEPTEAAAPPPAAAVPPAAPAGAPEAAVPPAAEPVDTPPPPPTPLVAAAPSVAPPPAPAGAKPAAEVSPPAATVPTPSAAESLPPPVPPVSSAQTAAVPTPPAGGATPVPDQAHVYGLANGETRIVISAIKDSWIQVRDKDQKPLFTRELHAGDIYHVPNQPGLTMKTGMGSGLVITVDGRQAPAIGGAVRPEVLLDPDRLLAGTAVQ